VRVEFYCFWEGQRNHSGKGKIKTLAEIRDAPPKPHLSVNKLDISSFNVTTH
jgi:hypothetical protein